MVVGVAGDFALNLSCGLEDAGVVVVEVAAVNVGACARVCRGDRGAMFQDVEGTGIVDDGIAGGSDAMFDLVDGGSDGFEGDVFVAVFAAEPTNEVAHVEVQKEESGGKVDRTAAGELIGGFRDRAHGVEIAPGGEGTGGCVATQTSVSCHHVKGPAQGGPIRWRNVQPG